MRGAMAEMAEMTALPRIGDSGNKYCPAVQLNIARPQLYTSRTFIRYLSYRLTYILVGDGLTEQGVFGGEHIDQGDSPCGLSAMVPCSDLPQGYEAGRFHLLSLGVYVVLDRIPVVYFTGRLLHGGTPPLAPPTATQVETWAYRCVLIFYPASRMISGSTQVYMAASGIPDRGITLPHELFSARYISHNRYNFPYVV